MTATRNPDPRPTTYDEWWALKEERDQLHAELASLRIMLEGTQKGA